MKGRILLYMLAALMLLCSACSVPSLSPEPPLDVNVPAPDPMPGTAAPPDVPDPPESGSSLLPGYISGLDALPVPIRDHSEAASVLLMEHDMVARILYPVTGLEELDRVVEDWVQDTVSAYQAEVSESKIASDPAELTADYSSYLVHDSLLGVKLSGVFIGPQLAHPVDLSVSFNADLKTGALLSLTDVLLAGGYEALQARVIAQAGLVPEFVDAHLLDHWLLRPEGLEITLVRGDYLPMSSGTVTLLFPYEELTDICALPDGASPEMSKEDETPAAPDPTPAPEIDPSKPMLALTFDDGPSAHTERLLDAFAAHGGKGTFFVVGNMISGRADTLRRMSSEGHEIGGHSWDHRQLTKLGEKELTDQIMNTRAKIYDVTGVDPVLMRPPYGSCNKTVKAKAKELGVAMINWSVDTLDWKYKNADTVYQTVMDQAKDGAIILCHDLHKTTVEAMERAIPDLIAEGYQLVTVTQLLTSSGEPIEPGSLHFRK